MFIEDFYKIDYLKLIIIEYNYLNLIIYWI